MLILTWFPSAHCDPSHNSQTQIFLSFYLEKWFLHEKILHVSVSLHTKVHLQKLTDDLNHLNEACHYKFTTTMAFGTKIDIPKKRKPCCSKHYCEFQYIDKIFKWSCYLQNCGVWAMSSCYANSRVRNWVNMLKPVRFNRPTFFTHLLSLENVMWACSLSIYRMGFRNFMA